MVFAGLRPDIDMTAHRSFTFADKMAEAFAEKPLSEFNLNYMQDVSVDNAALIDGDTDDEDIPAVDTPASVSVVPRRTAFRGSSFTPLRRAALLPAMVSALLCLCAATASGAYRPRTRRCCIRTPPYA